MGHYRSEMVSEDEERKAADRKQAALARSVEKIQAAIDAKGLAHVLAELAADPVMFRIRY